MLIDTGGESSLGNAPDLLQQVLPTVHSCLHSEPNPINGPEKPIIVRFIICFSIKHTEGIRSPKTRSMNTFSNVIS